MSSPSAAGGLRQILYEAQRRQLQALNRGQLGQPSCRAVTHRRAMLDGDRGGLGAVATLVPQDVRPNQPPDLPGSAYDGRVT